MSRLQKQEGEAAHHVFYGKDREQNLNHRFYSEPNVRFSTLSGHSMTAAGDNSRFYFAYGANMVRPQMSIRCPGATFVGTARLPGFRFIINSGGYANIVPQAQGETWGVIWVLTASDEKALDEYEEIPEGVYEKVELDVVPTAGGIRKALVYFSKDRHPGVPQPGYMKEIVASARAHGLPGGYTEGLKAWLAASESGGGGKAG